MKIVTLNAWGGKVHKPLLDFFEKNKENIDIFCLQEIYNEPSKVNAEGDRFNLFSDIQNTLTEHKGYFRAAIEGYGLAIFVKKALSVLDEGDISIYKDPTYVSGSSHPRNMQYVSLIEDEKEYTVCNVHGVWTGGGKNDTEARINQSNIIKNYMDSVRGVKILCGDFNLLPTTKSISILEEKMRNLIKEYGVICTRTSFYTKPEKFADYIFVSPDVSVKEFKVLPDMVSDHSPIFLEI